MATKDNNNILVKIMQIEDIKEDSFISQGKEKNKTNYKTRGHSIGGNGTYRIIPPRYFLAIISEKDKFIGHIDLFSFLKEELNISRMMKKKKDKIFNFIKVSTLELEVIKKSQDDIDRYNPNDLMNYHELKINYIIDKNGENVKKWINEMKKVI
jgi:hypothetical protein